MVVKPSDSLIRCWVGLRTLDGLERRGDHDALDTGTTNQHVGK
jgi:hypothetical protein